MMTHRKARTRHDRRSQPHGIPAARLIADHGPAGTRDFAPTDTVRLLLPLRPALVGAR